MSSPAATTAALDLQNPFPGLRPFREDEADRFFGQEDSVEDVIYRLSRQRFLMLLGLSGCGKSSLINAGVLAQLRPALLPGGQPRWRIARLSPSDDPLGSLAQSLDLCFPTLAPVRGELERDTRAVTRLIERADLWLRAREATSLARSRALAARGETLMSFEDRGEALDVAIKAYSIEPTSEAVEAVAHAFPQQLTKLGHDGPVFTAAFSPDGQRVVTASDDKIARVWSAATGPVIAKLDGHAGSVTSAVFSPDGQRVVTASDDGTARIWDAATGDVLTKLEGHAGPVNSAAFSPDGQARSDGQ